ncbi:MAG: hypothetical protein Q9226_006342, partial [Calogaya cf. arnoldii]
CNVHERPLSADGFERLVKAYLHARGVKGNICSHTTAYFPHFCDNIVGGRIQRVMGAKLPRKFSPTRRNLRCNDLLRAPRLQALYHSQSDRASSQHQHRTYEAIVVAAVDETISTGATCTIVYDWLDRDSLADFNVGHIVPNLFDDTAELVAKGDGSLFFGNGMRCGWNNIGAVLPFVEVYYR